MNGIRRQMVSAALREQPKVTSPTTGLAVDLARRQDTKGRFIHVGLIGSGEMATDIVIQCDQMAGITMVAITEINIVVARKALRIVGRGPESFSVAYSKSAFDVALKSGPTASADDAQAVCTNDQIEVINDTRGRTTVGAAIGLTAIEHGKHLVMMNVDADVTIGANQQHETRRLDALYTLGAGDEPSSCLEPINFVTGVGYPIVAAGKGKNNPLNIGATPTRYRDEANRRNMNPRMPDLQPGKGPSYTFCRPYHLTNLEVPLSCAPAVLYGTADMQPLPHPSSEVCAMAKKDLVPGDRPDAIDDYTDRASVMPYDRAKTAQAIPCDLHESVVVTKPIKYGELITTQNAIVDAMSGIVKLHVRLDAHLAGTA